MPFATGRVPPLASPFPEIEEIIAFDQANLRGHTSLVKSIIDFWRSQVKLPQQQN